jgi:predicted HTH domain antitoxin
MFEDLKRTSGDGDWIFSASPRANLSANFGRLGAALKKVTGVAFGFHALRATCATGAGRLGAPPHVIAVLLGHHGVPGTPHVTSRYDRADRLPEVRQALDRWGEHVEELTDKASNIPKAAAPSGTRGCLTVAANGAAVEVAESALARQRASSDTLEAESEMTVAVDIPDDLERRLRAGWADMPRKVLEAVALEAYRSGALTGAEVQRLLGLESRWDLEAFLKQAGVFLDYDQADLARDLEAFRHSGRP